MQTLNESFSVPKNYRELQSRFGAHIEKLLQKKNQCAGNFEDLHSYVWMRILEARLLERFQEYLCTHGIKVLTVPQVCDFLGITRQQWVDACVASHTGARHIWMPTPVNVEQYRIEGVCWYDASTALFAFSDIVHLTYGQRIHGELLWPFDDWAPSYDIGVSEVVAHLKYPQVTSTLSHFKHYLNRAVLNSHHNFCRTVKRRHKERPQSPQGNDGHVTPWEDTLVERSQASIDVHLLASEARTILREALQHSLADQGIPCSGDEGNRVCDLLQQGMTLQAALKQCGFTAKQRKSVISSIKLRSEVYAVAS